MWHSSCELDVRGTFANTCVNVSLVTHLASGTPYSRAHAMQSMFNLIYRGKGKMPGYGVECAPKVRAGKAVHLLLVCAACYNIFSGESKK